MKAVILAGGLGTRLGEGSRLLPKPMVEIGGKPLLWHIMSIFSHQGFREFIVALGHRQEVIKDYFLHLNKINSDLEIDLETGMVSAEPRRKLDWKVRLVDTGAHTMTGGRLKRLGGHLAGCGNFLLTYGDGVADVDLPKLVAFHESHGKLATVTAVRAPEQFGRLQLDGEEVREFAEKPPEGGGWINGGFFVLNEKALQFIDGEDTSWEREPMEHLVSIGELMAYRHEGFWSSVNTQDDKASLEAWWQENRAPWKVW